MTHTKSQTQEPEGHIVKAPDENPEAYVAAIAAKKFGVRLGDMTNAPSTTLDGSKMTYVVYGLVDDARHLIVFGTDAPGEPGGRSYSADLLEGFDPEMLAAKAA